MKTPTIIVRLIGLYLLANCSIALLQIHQVGGIGMQANSIINNMQLYAIFGLVIGVATSLFAGPLARFLTFDAEAITEKDEFTDKLFKRKNEKV
jgi:hypothetical protein